MTTEIIAIKREKPILFNGDMVRAILDGRKTQTRRVVKGLALEWLEEDKFIPEFVASPENDMCHLGKIGDQLWVRETFGVEVRNYGGGSGEFTVYKASNPAAVYCTTAAGKSLPIKWKPSIHMPRWASRIQLEITGIRVERLQDISEEDAVAEGAQPIGCDHIRRSCEDIGCYGDTAKARFRGIWESTGSDWDANPWVWVIEFKRVEVTA